MPRKYCCPYSAEELQHFFVDCEKTLDEMCVILGVSRNTASKVLRNAGIDTDVSGRTFEKAKAGMSDADFKMFLLSEYCEKEKSYSTIAEELGVSVSTVGNYLKKFGIQPRPRERATPKKMAAVTSVRDKLGMTEDEFRAYLTQKYENGYSMGEIANEIGMTASGVRRYFEKYDIKRRTNTAFMADPSKCPTWKGGKRITNHGYVEIYCPNHPNSNKRHCVYEHQLVVEDHIGRFISKGEVVHHIDGNKQNNNISNLLLLSNSEHARLHAILKSADKRMNSHKEAI